MEDRKHKDRCGAGVAGGGEAGGAREGRPASYVPFPCSPPSPSAVGSGEHDDNDDNGAEDSDTGDISTHCENGLLMVIVKKRMLPEKKTTSAALLPVGRHLGGLDKDGEERKREGEEDWFADV
uniref:Uncharacterized protein n=1 Tax=Oryza glaberrima TaxID=4538 RepID=I1NM08_ORYGL